MDGDEYDTDQLDISSLTIHQAQDIYDDCGELDVDFIQTYFRPGLLYHEGRIVVPACTLKPTGMKSTHIIFEDGSCLTATELFEIIRLPFTKFTHLYTSHMSFWILIHVLWKMRRMMNDHIWILHLRMTIALISPL